MLYPEYEGSFHVHQSVERFFGQIGNQIREDFKLLGSRRFWANLMGTAEGAGIMALGAVIFYRSNRPKWWKLAN